MPSDLEVKISKVLDRLGVVYEQEYPTRSGYILDFAILDKKIDLEVDGPHHRFPDRRKKDGYRTHILKQEGWTVRRIDYSLIVNNGPNLLEETVRSLVS